MRWHGIIGATKLFAHAEPTALTALADPARFANSAYDQVFPTGTFRIAFQTD
jgi:hypothetical protein